VKRSLDGKEVQDYGKVIQIYELCKTFHVLPSQLDKEDARDIDMLLIVHNAVGSHEKKSERKGKRDELKKKMGGGTQRR
jgi:hypothetical protein